MSADETRQSDEQVTVDGRQYAVHANGHQWPCAGFYTGNHDPIRAGAWTCTCPKEATMTLPTYVYVASSSWSATRAPEGGSDA